MEEPREGLSEPVKRWRARDLAIGAALGILLIALAVLAWTSLTDRVPVHPGQGRDGYVPCPVGMRAKPAQPHICVPAEPAANPGIEKGDQDRLRLPRGGPTAHKR